MVNAKQSETRLRNLVKKYLSYSSKIVSFPNPGVIAVVVVASCLLFWREINGVTHCKVCLLIELRLRLHYFPKLLQSWSVTARSSSSQTHAHTNSHSLSLSLSLSLFNSLCQCLLSNSLSSIFL